MNLAHRKKSPWGVAIVIGALAMAMLPPASGISSTARALSIPAQVEERAGVHVSGRSLAADPAADPRLIRLVNWEGERVNQVGFSPDGKVLAGASSLGIHLFDAHSLQSLRFIPADTWVRALAFSPDSAVVAAGSYDRKVRLWRIADGALLRTLGPVADEVHGISFSPDGALLAAASNDDAVHVWRVADGLPLTTIRQHVEGVRSVAFSPDGTLLASAGSDNVVRLWRVGDGALLRELNGHTAWVRTVTFSPDGKLLASGGFDRTARLWRVSDGTLLLTLKGHSSSILSVAFSPDGKTLATGSVDKTIGLWRVADGALLDVLAGHTGFVFSAAFSPWGQQLASGSMDGTLRIWNVGDGQKFSPGASASTWVGEAAPQDCRVCHHPRGDSRSVPVSDIACKACHTEGAGLNWCTNFPRGASPEATPAGSP